MTENLREGHFFRVLKDKATDTWDRLSFWTKARDVEFNDGRNLEERLPFDFAIDAKGNYGYKKMGADTVTPFRNPVGDATAADVLQGKVFSNAYSDNVVGTMVNRGSLNQTLAAGVRLPIEPGYYSGGAVIAKANSDTYVLGSENKVYDMGAFSNYRYADGRPTYNAGYADGYGKGSNSSRVEMYKVTSLEYVNESSSIISHESISSPSFNFNYPQSSSNVFIQNIEIQLLERVVIEGSPVTIKNVTVSVPALIIDGITTNKTLTTESFFMVPTRETMTGDGYAHTIYGLHNEKYVKQTRGTSLLQYTPNNGRLMCYYGYIDYPENDTAPFATRPASFDVYVAVGFGEQSDFRFKDFTL